MNLEAFAKLNIGLEVLGRRPDGLHDLRSLMVSVDLEDVLTLGHGDRTWVDSGAVEGAPEWDATQDLATRALKVLEEIGGRELGMGVHIHKRIPARAGLAGGSADAAAILRAGPALGVDAPAGRLLEVAMGLGADVPFQMVGGTALVEGAGERVEALPFIDAFAAIAFRGEGCSTAEVFAELREDEWSDGGSVMAAATALRGRPAGDLDDATLALLAALPNGLNAAARRRYPAVAEDAKALKAAGWLPRLTGTGGAHFQLVRVEDDARHLASAARAAGFQAWACRTLPGLASYAAPGPGGSAAE
ncbi:MAG: 4-diphosphocytidyl-2-C-methyl-D-erythritol kinase [Chloroflexota bacterium]|jgi:4-diphosphocytidyl-2-C-methyl-D-erythritol kinase|nr:4-diphosphocytidyl-2-C-methyl-D-erythritol kinase [Chloroflexota bacterium]